MPVRSCEFDHDVTHQPPLRREEREVERERGAAVLHRLPCDDGSAVPGADTMQDAAESKMVRQLQSGCAMEAAFLAHFGANSERCSVLKVMSQKGSDG